MRASVVLVDYGCGLDPTTLWAVADAATIQSHRDFGRPAPYGYGVFAQVRVAAGPNDVRAGEWILAYLPGVDSGGTLGYHNLSANGCPVMYVFPALEDPRMRGMVETHEIIETLADPWLNRVLPDAFGRLVACEPADPVEPSWYPIAARGRLIPVSNFVTPAYYMPRMYPYARYDFMGLLQYPGQLMPGGYASFLTPGGWSQQVNGACRAYRSLNRALSRSQRRTRDAGLRKQH